MLSHQAPIRWACWAGAMPGMLIEMPSPLGLWPLRLFRVQLRCQVLLLHAAVCWARDTRPEGLSALGSSGLPSPEAVSFLISVQQLEEPHATEFQPLSLKEQFHTHAQLVVLEDLQRPMMDAVWGERSPWFLLFKNKQKKIPTSPLSLFIFSSFKKIK